MGSLPGTSRSPRLEYGMAEAIRDRPAGRGKLPATEPTPTPQRDRHARGARDPRDVVNEDSPDSWAARWGSRPGKSILCPGGPGSVGRCPDHPHVHDRTGAAHPVTPDGQWAITRPDPPPPHWTQRRSHDDEQE